MLVQPSLLAAAEVSIACLWLFSGCFLCERNSPNWISIESFYFHVFVATVMQTAVFAYPAVVVSVGPSLFKQLLLLIQYLLAHALSQTPASKSTIEAATYRPI